ncbi:UTP--glucose-1-phosphate uridylyltransferase GalU [Telmatospirillum sp. J64-1]|uniref:UTP--glucose-1-phosphate uridylyltransferase GalU n=1 Tax=Telmatospirillum sp. J64-1 TaxID=2502183 RepID=UPI00115E27B3|nr:UTP--glucose-1-phosphate uridylyltransferase GalU [Telmatospirillum sp. J64-1]
MRRVRKAVFPVGGMGTRFLPATKAMPKEMLPVVDKPLIQYAVEEAAAAGIEHFIFVTGRGKTALEDHFDHAPDLERTLSERGKFKEIEMVTSWMPKSGQVSYTRQTEPLGLGHAVWCARDLVENEPFAVILPDDLILSKTPCLRQMVDLHTEVGGNVVAVIDVPREHVKRYGILDVEHDNGRIARAKGLIEKPDPETAPSTLSITGRYILHPRVFEFLDKQQKGAGNEIQLTDAIAQTIGGVPFHGLRFEGTRYDCGDKVGWLSANIAFALAREDMHDQVAEVVQSFVK